jgi:hypothetical protein
MVLFENCISETAVGISKRFNGDSALNLWDEFHFLSYRSPLWSSGQSSWLQIQRSGFDSLRFQIFWEVVGLERYPLSLVSTTEELLERKSSGFGLKPENTAVGIRHADHVAPLYPQKLSLTLPTSGGRSVGIVLSRTQVTEFSFLVL